VLEQFRDVIEGFGQGYARNELGLVQQLTGNYPAAALATSRRWTCSAISATGSARPGR
jgi:hypothetical protein